MDKDIYAELQLLPLSKVCLSGKLLCYICSICCTCCQLHISTLNISTLSWHSSRVATDHITSGNVVIEISLLGGMETWNFILLASSVHSETQSLLSWWGAHSDSQLTRIYTNSEFCKLCCSYLKINDMLQYVYLACGNAQLNKYNCDVPQYTVDPRLSEHLWPPNQFKPFG